MVGHFTTLIGAHTLKKWFVPALKVNFFKKLPQLVALLNFQSSYLSHGESLNHNYCHIIIRLILNIFLKALHILQKKRTTKLVAKILTTNFGFVTRGQFWPSGIVVACVCVCLCAGLQKATDLADLSSGRDLWPPLTHYFTSKFSNQYW